jgi:hypothetical protein
MTDNEMRDLFREMREEPVPADSLARVRAGIEKRTKRAASWKMGALLAVAASLVAGFLFLKPVKTPVPIEQSSAPEIAQVQLPPEPVVRNTARPKRVRPPQRVGAPVSIRIETPDPDVVILLVN